MRSVITLPWGGVGMPDSPDAAVAMVCGRQLQGQAGGQRWSRGQRLLLEDELRSEIYLSGAHHDLCSRKQCCLSLVVILQHLRTGWGWGGACGRGVASPALWLSRANSLMAQWVPFLCGRPGTCHGMLVPQVATLEYSSF